MNHRIRVIKKEKKWCFFFYPCFSSVVHEWPMHTQSYIHMLWAHVINYWQQYMDGVGWYRLQIKHHCYDGLVTQQISCPSNSLVFFPLWDEISNEQLTTLKFNFAIFLTLTINKIALCNVKGSIMLNLLRIPLHWSCEQLLSTCSTVWSNWHMHHMITSTALYIKSVAAISRTWCRTRYTAV